ncbi:TetR/AcrR family transcriptional regulator [Pokkaliibacter plantistimulans]|uniref:TetR/AcrR family transcriptional regulator n=1 Tax=Proteobacteria bacterium 228 TaxID=2083153 RepID=A0A2S5KP71_9PROT|nr:TetR/AcrR family transcriptional regulator [Pokkaliibacter plantistimulans]PPC76611.1 TetR/AcrR family transcriptional regulator [Pokkaliibacter plantistimulans]
MSTKRSQSERSRETQGQVMKATLECILQKGIRETSTVDVARQAGVSRGALMHHYPSKEALMHAALETLLSDEITKVQAMASDVSAGKMDFDAFLQALWEHFAGDLFMITLEYLTAARTDPAIQDVLTPLAAHYNESMEQIWEQLIGNEHGQHQRRVALNVTLCMLRGMAAQSIWRDDPVLYQGMLQFWKKTLIDIGFLPANRSA